MTENNKITEHESHFSELFELAKSRTPIDEWWPGRYDDVRGVSYSEELSAPAICNESNFVNDDGVFFNPIGEEDFIFFVQSCRGRFPAEHPTLVEWMSLRPKSKEEMLQQIFRIAAHDLEDAVRIIRNPEHCYFGQSNASLSTGEYFIDPWVGDSEALYKALIEPVKKELLSKQRTLFVFAPDLRYWGGKNFGLPGELLGTVECIPQ